MKKFIIILILCVTAFKLNSKELTISKINSNVNIDGKADEAFWNSVPFNEIEQNLGDAKCKNNNAHFKMVYDASFVYVYVEVEDSQIDTSQSKNVWEKDCVELYFGMDTSNQPVYFPKTAGIAKFRKVFGRPMIDYPSKGFVAEEYKTDKGFGQEWKLCRDSLANIQSELPMNYVKKLFRFECVNSDNDGTGRVSILHWNSNMESSTYSGVITGWWGLIYLGFPLAVEKPEIIESSIIIKKDIIQFTKTSDYNLYNISGEIIKQGRKCNNLIIKDLQKGVYMISANGENLKFVK